MNEEQIWKSLRSKGFSEYASAALMGNIKAESDFHADRVQGDIPYSSFSLDYTRKVDSGEISKNDFIYNGPNGSGYGLCQWTFWSRKRGLYEHWKEYGCASIGNCEMQLDYISHEINEKYPSVHNDLKCSKSVEEVSKIILQKYEQPAGLYDETIIAQRASYSNDFYEKFKGIAIERDDMMLSGTYPEIKKGDKGEYVRLAQQLLIYKGYSVGSDGADGDFGTATHNTVIFFQSVNGLYQDGIIGSATWRKLCEGANETVTTIYIPEVVNIALSYEGYLEKATPYDMEDKTANAGRNNWNRFAAYIDNNFPNFYNGKKNGFAWCDCFVDACFLEAYGYENTLKLLCAPEKSTGAGCKFSAEFFKEKGRWVSTPRVGDQIFFGPSGNEAHTGIVYLVDDNYVYTIEGNTSSEEGVIPNGGGVFKKKYSLSNSSISGYGRPDYSIVTPVELPVEPEKPVVKEDESKSNAINLLTQAINILKGE